MLKRSLLVPAAMALALAGCKETHSPAETASHLKAAQDFYAAKDFNKALVEIQVAIKGDPRNGDAHYLAAQIHEGLNNPKGAIEEYARAASPDANNLKAQLKFEQILIDANQLDTAVGRINSTLGSHPNDPDALALRALAEQRQGSIDKAKGDAQAALSHMPGQPIATAVMASEALKDKMGDKALAILAPALKLHPDDVGLNRLRAAGLLQQDKKDEAIAIYETLVQKNPNDTLLQAALAELYASADKVDTGETLLRDAVAKAPKNRDLRIALVVYLAKHRGADASDAELKTAIRDNPQDTAFDMIRAEQQTRAKDLDGAAATLQAAVTRVPDGPARAVAQLALAKLDISRGDSGAARKLLDDALAAKSDNDDALLLRAGILIGADQAAQAIPDLLAVASRRPRSPAPLALLADAYLKQGDTDKAIDALKKVAYFEPKNLNPVAQLAALQLKQNKPDLAKQAINEYVARNPESLDGRLAQVRFAVGQKDWGAAQTAIDQMRRVPKADQAMAILNAELSEAKGDPAAAATAYQRLIDPSRPFSRDALVGYARSSVAAKQTDRAIATLSALVAQKTGDDAAAAGLVLSSLYRAAGQPDKASDSTAAAMKAAPTQPGPYLDAALAAGQDLAQATSVLDAGIAAGAPSEPLLLTRASLEDKAGNKDAEIATYQEILKANPRSLIAANNYASLVADAKPTDKALLTSAREPLQRFAEAANPSLLDTLAWLDYRLGDYPSAKALLLRAKADTSPNPQLRFHYGAVLIAMGDKEAGRAAIKAALNQPFPGHDEAEKMLTD